MSPKNSHNEFTATKLMFSPQNHLVEWITLNIATIVTALFAFTGTQVLLEILGGLSLLVLMFFNFWRAMNEYADYMKKRRDAKTEKLRSNQPKNIEDEIHEEDETRI